MHFDLDGHLTRVSCSQSPYARLWQLGRLIRTFAHAAASADSDYREHIPVAQSPPRMPQSEDGPFGPSQLRIATQLVLLLARLGLKKAAEEFCEHVQMQTARAMKYTVDVHYGVPVTNRNLNTRKTYCLSMLGHTWESLEVFLRSSLRRLIFAEAQRKHVRGSAEEISRYDGWFNGTGRLSKTRK